MKSLLCLAIKCTLRVQPVALMATVGFSEFFIGIQRATLAGFGRGAQGFFAMLAWLSAWSK